MTTASPLSAPALAAVALLALGLWACSSDSASGGDGDATPVDGGGDGDLTVDFSTPDLGGDGEGDGGYRSDTVGQACASQQACESAEVCVGADPATGTMGYCTILDCATHADCDFGLDGPVFCCSDFGQYRGCFLEGEGAVCGEGAGVQGDDCSAGGQSDCAGDQFYCIDVYNERFCAGECDPRAPGDCGAGSWCYPTSGTSGLCLPSGDTGSLEPCVADPLSCEPGSVCDGAFADPPSPTSFCAQVCTRDRDCLATEWCRVYPGQGGGTCIPIGEAGDGESCAEDRWACQEGLYCLNEGTRVAQCARLCERPDECGDEQACNFFSDVLGVCQTAGDRQTGEPCGDDPFACVPGAVCIGADAVGYAPDAYCSESCTINPTTCGDGYYCQDFGDQGDYCLPDGDVGPGGACSGPADCAADTACLYGHFGGEDGVGRCQPTCGPDRPCPPGQWCTADGEEGLCLPRGQRAAGASCADDPFDCEQGTFCGGDPPICLQGCAEDAASCPEGLYCGENGGNYCFPAGDTPVGDACTETYECVEGSFCAFMGEGAAGVCTDGCAGPDECAAGYWCLQTANAGLCVPDGAVGPGGDCTADRFSCDAGNVCVLTETDAAYCARDCTGFATRCGEGEACRWVGSGLSLCLMVGDVAPGGSCAADPTACDASGRCVDAGQQDAFCAAECTFDSGACGEGTECRFFPNGLGLCLPPGWEGGGPL